MLEAIIPCSLYFQKEKSISSLAFAVGFYLLINEIENKEKNSAALHPTLHL